MTNTPDGNLLFVYHFDLGQNISRDFAVQLDGKSLAVLESPRDSYPEWTQLACQQCPVCPLETAKHTHCPIAKNITGLIEFFGQFNGNEKIHLTIHTEARNFDKKTDLYAALSAILGIYMVTSGCPVMDKLRPMVKFHLPFASEEESMARAMSMYLIAQFLRARRKRAVDWDMNNLSVLYDDINLVNFFFMQRLKTASVSNAALSAIVNLDITSRNVNFSLSGDANQAMLQRLEKLYQ